MGALDGAECHTSEALLILSILLRWGVAFMAPRKRLLMMLLLATEGVCTAAPRISAERNEQRLFS
jgi:hypothetical protein